MTEGELIAAILASQEQDTENLPRCGPGEICPAILIWRHDMGDKAARRLLRKAMIAGVVKPDWVTFYDAWGNTRRVMGYRASKQSSNGTS